MAAGPGLNGPNAVAARISHKYQVLMDDGNRIVVPLGNFKCFPCSWYRTCIESANVEL